MARTVVVDCFPESAERFRDGYAVVAIDVIRATTTMVTAVEQGLRCFPAPTLEAIVPLAARLDRPLLAGELGGSMPYGFDLQNSPAAVAALSETSRPMILLSTSGTRLVNGAPEADAVYVACLRNMAAVTRRLIDVHERVAVIGAGTRGEFREEDQYCCAHIAAGLLDAGFEGEGRWTSEVVERWRDQPVDTILVSNSAEYLRRSGQLADLDFVLAHVDDVDAAHRFDGDEVVKA